jgi:hypothetical protein
MILGRNPALFLALVQAVLGLLLAFGVPITLQQLGAIEAVASVIVGLVANSATPGTVPTFSLRTKADAASWRDLR